MDRRKYRKREEQKVLAVQLNLETEGFTYRKWGSSQQCSAGDWIVNNEGECYTISQDSFRRTYAEIAPGQFIKTAAVWAEQAASNGKVKTKEGHTAYEAGDYLVSNEEDSSDEYAISKARFEAMYKCCE